MSKRHVGRTSQVLELSGLWSLKNIPGSWDDPGLLKGSPDLWCVWGGVSPFLSMKPYSTIATRGRQKTLLHIQSANFFEGHFFQLCFSIHQKVTVSPVSESNPGRLYCSSTSGQWEGGGRLPQKYALNHAIWRSDEK